MIRSLDIGVIADFYRRNEGCKTLQSTGTQTAAEKIAQLGEGQHRGWLMASTMAMPRWWLLGRSPLLLLMLVPDSPHTMVLVTVCMC